MLNLIRAALTGSPVSSALSCSARSSTYSEMSSDFASSALSACWGAAISWWNGCEMRIVF